MRIRPTLATCLWAISLGACSCEENITTSSGIFVMAPRALEWGTVCQGETSERQLTLRNDGNATLTITNVELKDGGGVFSLLEDLPTEIEGGGSVVVRLGLTPPADGDYAGKLTITTDAEDPEKATQSAVLVGKGFRGKKLDFQVTCLCDEVEDVGASGGKSTACGLAEGKEQSCNFLTFLHVPAKSTADAQVKVKNLGCGLLHVQEGVIEQYGFEPDEASMFKFTTPTAFTLHGSEEATVKVQFQAPDRDSLPSPLLKLRTNDPESKDSSGAWPAGEWRLYLQADSVVPALLVTPSVLTYFEATEGVPESQEIEIANTGTAPLKIDSVTLNPEGGTQDFKLELANGETSFTLPQTGVPGSTRKIQAVYTASASGGSSDAADVVVKAGALTATVKLLGGAEPHLELKWLDAGTEMDPPVDFGDVATGTKGTTRTLRLRNTGKAPLLVTSVTIPDVDNPNGAFKVGAGVPSSLAPAQQADVTLTFDDVVNLRDDRAKLEVVTNDRVDTNGKRTIDLVSRNEPNFAPVVIIEVSAAPQVGKPLELDGSGSYSEPGDTLTYAWSLARKPTNSTARIENPTAAVTKIVNDGGDGPDLVGTYIVRLEVSDQFGNRTPPLSQSITVAR